MPLCAAVPAAAPPISAALLCGCIHTCTTTVQPYEGTFVHVITCIVRVRVQYRIRVLYSCTRTVHVKIKLFFTHYVKPPVHVRVHVHVLSSRADCTRTCANMRGPRAFCIISAPVLSRKIPVYYLYELSSPTEETAVPGVRCAHHRARNARREIGFLKGN